MMMTRQRLLIQIDGPRLNTDDAASLLRCYALFLLGQIEKKGGASLLCDEKSKA